MEVNVNYHHNKNERGFDAIEDAPYCSEAWNFILAGDGLFNYLDYSFTIGNEDGTFVIGKGMPGGGGVILRNQMYLLPDLMKGLEYIHMDTLLTSNKNIKIEKNLIDQLITLPLLGILILATTGFKEEIDDYPDPARNPESPIMLVGDWFDDPHHIDFDALPRIPKQHIVISDVTAQGGVNQHNYLGPPHIVLKY